MRGSRLTGLIAERAQIGGGIDVHARGPTRNRHHRIRVCIQNSTRAAITVEGYKFIREMLEKTG